MAAARELIIVGGANGTGKTTFAMQYVAEYGVPYLGADAIAAELAPHDPASVQVQAGRQFVVKVNQYLDRGETFVVESTLSGVTLKRTIEQARLKGYKVSIYYVFVDSPDTCVARVALRVRRGGHHVPELDIRRRFGRSMHNFWNVYRELADTWVLMYNGPGLSGDVAIGSHTETSIRDSNLLRLFRDRVPVLKP
ncbi:AAA family ATPase [Aeoliella sp. SH292]|uniref:AAA family ATPase n=1 Tax=Aeoliella sp. SH292 TaxID=3454464 RepID=UPI003F965DEB